jgi:hypothetical protein
MPGTTSIAAVNGENAAMAETVITPRDQNSAVATLNALLPSANRGDADAVAAIREVLAEHPALWDQLGDLGQQTERGLVRVAAGTNPIIREATQRKLTQLRRELAGPHPSPLERLLVDRIVVGWLGLVVAEGSYHTALEQGIDQADDAFHQQRVERAQRRYLAAIKTLAQVRKLGLPAVQVNIGEKQMNVAR